MRTFPEYVEDTGAVKADWVAIRRKLFEHPMFRDERYDRRSAWIWLIAYAAYKPCRVLNKGREVMLERGQLMAAHGYLAKAWHWNQDTVRRFLARLEKAGMVSRRRVVGESSPTNQCQVLEVCNYDKYQLDGTGERQANAWRAPGERQQYKKVIRRLNSACARGLEAPRAAWRQEGVTIRDTSESFDDYRTRMIREGKLHAS